MSRTRFIAAIAASLAILALATPSQAQLGGLFDAFRPNPQRGAPPPAEEEDVPDLPRGGRVLPSRPPPPQPNLTAPPPGSVQNQPLAPPPGSTAPPPGAPPQQNAAPAPLPGLPPGQRQPRAPAGAAPPTPATLQPGDEVVTEPPAQKVVNKQAMFSGLDKITGRIIAFDAEMGETVQFGALRVKPRACYTRPATEAANTDAFVEVEEITLQGEVKRIFSGWMFAASPGLHGVEHPIYDIWLTDCKGSLQTISTAPPELPKPVAPPPQQRRQQQPRAQTAPPPGAPPQPQQPRPQPQVQAPPPQPQQQPPQQRGFSFPTFGN